MKSIFVFSIALFSLFAVSAAPVNQEWKVLDKKGFDAPGTIMDFSWMLDAPAGKYGHAKVNQSGHLSFEKSANRNVRFYGVNLCYSAVFPDKAGAEKLADELARAGYNSVRLHHYDGMLTAGSSPATLRLDPKLLDRHDYLIYCMKRRGIYLTIDLYCDRKLQKGEIPDVDGKNLKRLKGLIPIRKEAMDGWKKYSSLLLSHRNPYTGMTLAEDPALLFVNLINEGSILKHSGKTDYLKKIYKQAYQKYLDSRKLKDSPGQYASFLINTKVAAINSMTHYLKKELKLKALITDSNYTQDAELTYLRNRLDLVDNHTYWNHLQKVNGWTMPFKFNNKSAVECLAYAPRVLMPTRIYGKPFVVSEFNYCYPNTFRVEGGALMGAYAAFQDWDALYRFTWANNVSLTKKARPIFMFNVVSDISARLSDKIAMLLFTRNDVMKARKRYPVWFDSALLKHPGKSRLPSLWNYSFLGLNGSIGAVVSNSKPKNAVLEIGSNSFQQRIRQLENNLGMDREKPLVSDTGEIVLNSPANIFKVISPKTALLSCPAGSHQAGPVTVDSKSDFSLFCVSSMDGGNIQKSTNLLFIHLTDVQNSNVKFKDEKRTLLQRWGTAPLLLRRGIASVKLKLDPSSTYKVTALDLDGRPKSRLNSKCRNGILEFEIDNFSGGGTLLYSISKN